MPHIAALDRVLRKLRAHGLPHFPWNEPDHGFGLTAIATAPLLADSPERELMKDYRLYRAPVVSSVSTPDSKSGSVAQTHRERHAGAVV